MNDDGSTMREREARTVEIHKLIRSTFPAHIYDDVITSYDDNLEDPELDEEKELYEQLKGKKWTDIPQQVIDSHPDGYVLLVIQAFVAFIAAWFTRSLENMEGENEVRDFLIYSFSPKHDMIPDTTESVLSRLRALSPKQRNVLHLLLTEFAERDPSAFQRRLALDAVALLESVD